MLSETFTAPELAADSQLCVVLQSALKVRGFEGVSRRPDPAPPYWNAAHFGLERVAVFREATQEKQNRILSIASAQLLEEAYFIEKAGMSFTAKMTLLSESTQEKMMYSLFASDEAAHLHYVLTALGKAPDPHSAGPFVALLSAMIREGDRASLVFLIQVILEGWGLLHYRNLAENCADPDVAEKLRLILKDEARHHGSGMILTKAHGLDSRQKSYVLEVLVNFLKLIQAGPVGLVATMESVLGSFSPAEKQKIFEELQGEESTIRKITIIRSLMGQGGGAELIPALEKAGVLNPFTSTQFAKREQA